MSPGCSIFFNWKLPLVFFCILSSFYWVKTLSFRTFLTSPGLLSLSVFVSGKTSLYHSLTPLVTDCRVNFDKDQNTTSFETSIPFVVLNRIGTKHPRLTLSLPCHPSKVRTHSTNSRFFLTVHLFRHLGNEQK